VSALAWFYVIACAATAALTMLLDVSIVFGLAALFGPAIGAVIVTRAASGRAGVSDLLRRTVRWRVGLGWYVVAILITEAVTLAAAAAPALWGGPVRIEHLPLDGLKVALFVTVVGEEIGWRGFALPRLMAYWRATPASVILGLMWGLWHLPTFFLAGTAQSQFPFPAYLLYTTALSVLMTWLFFRTQGSVFFATVFHGCVNTFVVTNPALEPATLHWLQAGSYAAAALLVVRFAGPPFRRR
jgi:membrane protease YdiL (CAAX protease family)